MEGVYNRKDQQSSFWQFSDQLRLETTANLSNLSLGDSIWSDSSFAKRADDRRNFDGPLSAQSSEFGWKLGLALPQKLATATATDRYSYNHNHNHNAADNSAYNNSSKKGFGDASNGIKNWNYYNNNNNYSNGEIKNYYFNKHGNGGGRNGIGNNNDGIGGSGKKKGSNGKNNSGGNGNNGAVDKRFKTLPPSEALPRNEAVGGYIFVCNNETMEENLQRQLFGLPPRYRDSVRAITPGLPLFLYNYSTHQLHGIFEATSFGGTNIDPIAWEDKKCPGESRFPAQVRVMTRKLCEPLEEDAFRPILHHYDGPKFRLELNVQEALALLDIFAEQNA
ncbi:B2 protein-like [Ananas comosus]|uniref:B2 protein-like n=1 Tax=Ananas comosus TaxID=4615 RepID=A0A6P5GDL0_ANACO|nr:B2 protein-like [Ananas comosus]